MQNMHEQSPIALLRFFYCDLAVLIDPFLELARFGIFLDDLIDDLHEIVIAHLHRYSGDFLCSFELYIGKSEIIIENQVLFSYDAFEHDPIELFILQLQDRIRYAGEPESFRAFDFLCRS